MGQQAGTVMKCVGGGAFPDQSRRRFIDAAGGPNALIVDVPTAGVTPRISTYCWRGANFLRAAGQRARRHPAHDGQARVADGEQFAACWPAQGAFWFEEAGNGTSWTATRARQQSGAFHDVPRARRRGGQFVHRRLHLSSYMLRGARAAGNETIMAPAMNWASAFSQRRRIDQHVVARERLRDLATSSLVLTRHPELLGISERRHRMGGSRRHGRHHRPQQTFVYGGADPDGRKPFPHAFTTRATQVQSRGARSHTPRPR
jgi:cyanophycinase